MRVGGGDITLFPPALDATKTLSNDAIPSGCPFRSHDSDKPIPRPILSQRDAHIRRTPIRAPFSPPRLLPGGQTLVLGEFVLRRSIVLGWACLNHGTGKGTRRRMASLLKVFVASKARWKKSNIPSAHPHIACFQGRSLTFSLTHYFALFLPQISPLAAVSNCRLGCHLVLLLIGGSN